MYDLSSLLRGSWFSKREIPANLLLKWVAEVPNLIRPLIPKGCNGHHYQFISRNGRVLIFSDVPVGALQGKPGLFTLRPWRRALLPGDAPEVRGVLIRILTRLPAERIEHFFCCQALVDRHPDPTALLSLDLGGQCHLLFFSRSSGKIDYKSVPH